MAIKKTKPTNEPSKRKSDSRSNGISVITGMQGVGKSYNLNNRIRQYADFHKRPVIVYDVNDEYADYEIVRWADIKTLKGGVVRRVLPYKQKRSGNKVREIKAFDMEDLRNGFFYLLENFKNGCLVLDDFNSYTITTRKTNILSTLTRARHHGLDIIIVLQELGKVTKDPLIAFEKRTKQTHLGGVLAVAKHFSGLGINSSVISKWASTDHEFISSEVSTNKAIKLINLESNKSIKKTRYVDRSSNARVFESYELPNENDYSTTPKEIKDTIREHNVTFDHLVVMDYGHNFFDHQKTAEYMNFGVPVSVNTQSNAGNRGFNPVSNYVKADIVFLNGSEVQVEMRNKVSKLDKIVTDLGNKLDCKELYVTNGSAGITSWSKEKGIMVSPTFAPTILDRTGAGDALLAAVSSLRMNNVPIEIATFFGNIAGSLLVGVMGNEKAITSADLQYEADKIINKVKTL